MTSANALPLPIFRHDPAKSVLTGGRCHGSFRWDQEPAVCGYTRLTFRKNENTAPIDVPVSASPAIVAGVGVVVASDDGFVRLLDLSLKKAFWWIRLKASIYASLVTDRRRRHIFVADTKGTVVCVDLRGEVVWTRSLDHGVLATPTVLDDAGVLVICTLYWRCVGLDMATGERVFDQPLPRPWHTAYSGLAAHRDAYASPAVGPGGRIVACCGEHAVGVDADGTERWRTDLDAALRASPVVLGGTGRVAVFGVDGRCSVLDLDNGRVLATLSLGSKLTASPAVSGRVLAVGLQGGVTIGIDHLEFQEAWRSDQGAPRSYTSWSTLPSGDFVCTNDRGNALCLDARTGAFRWESSQLLGLPDHEPQMDITPIAAVDGSMVCASYHGDVYRFAFRSGSYDANRP